MAVKGSLARLLIAACAFALASCDGDDGSSTDGDGGQDSGTDTGTDADAGGDGGESDGGLGERAVGVSAGDNHTCAVLEGGHVKCWGNQQWGQLGYGPDLDGVPSANLSLPSTLPFVDVGDPVAEILAGSAYTCALTEERNLRCWGWGSGGTLGVDVINSSGTIGRYDVPADYAAIDFGVPIRGYSVGGKATCVVLEGGDLVCFGSGILGYYGAGVGYDVEDPPSSDRVALGGAAAQVSTGLEHICAVTEGGEVYCWGVGYNGALGYGNKDDVYEPLEAGPVDVGGAVVQVACGYYHTCALLDSGDVVCWGSGEYGALGYGNTDTIGDDEVPASVGQVDIGEGVTQITAGNQRTCVLLESEAVKCWGSFGGGALGYGNQENIGDDEVPADVSAVDIGEPVVRIDSGYAHNCALAESGSIYCWGLGQYGRLGYGNEESIGDDETPADVGPVPLL